MEPEAEIREKPVRLSAGRRPIRRLVGWMVLVVLTLMAVQHAPYEASYWLLASAQKAQLAGRTDDALLLADQAAKWTPEEFLPYQVRLEILLSAGRSSEAVAAIDKLLERDPPNRQKVVLRLVKSRYYLQQKQYDDSLREFDEAAKFDHKLRPSSERVQLLMLADRREEAKQELPLAIAAQSAWDVTGRLDNDAAYFSALLDENLEDALERANRAVARTGEKVGGILDTRGYVLYRQGKYREAVLDLTRAVELEEKDHAGRIASLEGSARKEADRQLAVIVYHRSLVYRALKMVGQAEADERRVRQLGFEPTDELF